jgi:hypothetical protein
VCGAVAAGVWALAQPLDKALFDSAYDDVEFLGKALTRGRGWYPAGLALHLFNGALFGALYANVAPWLPMPSFTRGPAVSLLEHCAGWPLTSLGDRVHPASDELVALNGNRRAFAQGAVRHLLFGAVLGELERRVNPPADRFVPPPPPDYSTNGHGSLEHAVTGEPL